MPHRNTFGIPDIPAEPCLLLCSQMTFLALAFADKAFKAPDLTCAENLFKLGVLPGKREQVLDWHDSWLNRPIFRRTEQTVRGTQISKCEPWTATSLSARLKRVGIVTGMDLPTGAYTFRRGNGEALDSSSKFLLRISNSG